MVSKKNGLTIRGVVLKNLGTVEDDRGVLVPQPNIHAHVLFRECYEIHDRKGSVHGNHYHPSNTKEEIISVLEGMIEVIICDLRQKSPTFNHKNKIVLRSHQAIVVPCGVAHALRILTQGAIILVFANRRYNKKNEILYRLI